MVNVRIVIVIFSTALRTFEFEFLYLVLNIAYISSSKMYIINKLQLFPVGVDCPVQFHDNKSVLFNKFN